MAQATSRIVKTPEVIGGKPRIDGTRLSVYFVREKVEGAGMDPKTFAAKFNVDVADVYHALAYFHDHPDEMAHIAQKRAHDEQAARERGMVTLGELERGEVDPDDV